MYKVITIFLIIFLILCIISPWLIYFTAEGLYLLAPFIYFTHPTLLSSGKPPFVLWICSLCLFKFCFACFVFIDSTYNWDHMVFLFLWLIALGVIPSRSIHIASNGKISHFLWLSNNPLCVYSPHLLYAVIYKWILCLLPYLGYWK